MHPKQLELIESLRKQSRKLAAGELLPEAIAILKEKLPALPEHIFLLSHVPEQGEDLYTFVLGTETVCGVEIPRSEEPGFIDWVQPFRGSRQGNYSKTDRRTIEAIEFICER